MKQWSGYILTALSAIGFSTLGIFAKYAYMHEVTVTNMVAWRFLLSAVILWVIMLITRQKLPTVRDILWLALMGGVGYNLMATFFLNANRFASAGLVSAMLYTYPALVTLQVALLGWEKFTLMRMVSLAGAAAGTLLVALSGENEPGSTVYLGVFYGLAAAVVYSVYITLGSRVVERVPPLTSTTFVCTAGAVVQVIYASATGALVIPPAPARLMIAGQVVLATVLAILFFFAGVSRIGPSRAAIVSTLEPVSAALLGIILLGEVLTPRQVVGVVVVLASIALLQLEKSVIRDKKSAGEVAGGASI
ncbi:MAG TPA: DMT family transporter [Firmicutes bacterium]|nr:DMT family transporter [Bacillota bacterium]